MSTCIKTFGSLTREQIEKDENLKINYSPTDKTMFNISLVDNEKAFAIPYTDDDFDYYKVRTDESILLFKYLFEKYDLYFVDEDIAEESYYVPNYAHSAFYWKLTTDYMLGFDWNDECKARIEAQREEWIDHYYFYEKIININKMLEIDNLLHKAFCNEEITEKDYNKINRFENYTLPILKENEEKYGLPKNMLISIDGGIYDLSEEIAQNNFKVIYPEKPKPSYIEFPKSNFNFNDPNLPF